MPTKLAASVLSVVSAVTGFGAGQAAPTDAPAAAKPTSFFGFRTTALDGSPVDLGAHRGKVVLVVNVASRCGYTSQYADLERLWQQYKDKGLVVIGFPCNDFGGQEPGSEKEIGEFCRATYGVTFPMMSKVGTKPGSGQSEIYAVLGATTGKLPSWNFGKYVVGRDGVPVAFYGSGVKPMGDELRTAIDAALAKPAPGGAPPAGAAADAPAAPKAP
ncbi:MAG: glutathione peroxidase [Phycisphaerales bacterium]